MARSRTLLQLRDEVRQRADMVNSAFVTDAEVDRCINQSWAQLYDRLLATGEDYYVKYVDLPSQASSSSAYSLTSAFPGHLTNPPTIIGTNGWSTSPLNAVTAIDLTTGAMQAAVALGNLKTTAAYDGTHYVVMHGNPATPSVHKYTPTVPPVLAAQTTTWSPALGAETIGARSGVLYDSVTGEYVTLIEDVPGLTCRIARFVFVGTVATETAFSANFARTTNSAVLLYMRNGRVAFFVDGVFRELETTGLTATCTVSTGLTSCYAAAYDPATQRALVTRFTPFAGPYYVVVDVPGQAVVGNIDAAVVAAGGSLAASWPTLTPGGKWLLSFVDTTAAPAINVGLPGVVEVDPATLACTAVASFPASHGLWALKTQTKFIASRCTYPRISAPSFFDTANLVYSASTSSDYYDFENYAASNGQLATDVYQVRGVDAVYSSEVTINLPRYNWEERNIYNAAPELNPYMPVTAYRVIQNPLNGNDCMQFIPSTPNGVSYYRVWYYPNPKVLVADTDSLDGRSGWEEWVVVDAAMKILAKEESDTTALEREATRIWARITTVAENRDAGQAKRITDVAFNSGSWPYNVGYNRRY